MRFAPFTLLLILIAACQSTKPSQQTLDVQAKQNRLYDVSDPVRFHKAAVKVLLAQGYAIRTKDDARGLIVAVAQRFDRANTILERIPGQSRLLKGELVEFTVSYAIDKGNVRARASLQRLAPYTLGGHEGIEVLDKSIYDGFYDAIMAEIKDVGTQADKNFVPSAVPLNSESSKTPIGTNSPSNPKSSPKPSPSPAAMPKPSPSPQSGVAASPTPRSTETAPAAAPLVESSPQPE